MVQLISIAPPVGNPVQVEAVTWAPVPCTHRANTDQSQTRESPTSVMQYPPAQHRRWTPPRIPDCASSASPCSGVGSSGLATVLVCSMGRMCRWSLAGRGLSPGWDARWADSVLDRTSARNGSNPAGSPPGCCSRIPASVTPEITNHQSWAGDGTL